jgi:hypothetical protein
MDSFNELSMRWDLQPGAVLAYMHAHSGLFNAVSQVIYFHFGSTEAERNSHSVGFKQAERTLHAIMVDVVCSNSRISADSRLRVSALTVKHSPI